MKRAMFVGAIGCGKTTLLQQLKHQTIAYDKTQSVEFFQNIIDTPGEYIEHRQMYTFLATTAMDANVVVLIQSATDQRLIFPEAFATMFGCPVVGVITKLDLVTTDKDIAWAQQQLRQAGATQIFQVSGLTGTNVDQLRAYLDDWFGVLRLFCRGGKSVAG